MPSSRWALPLLTHRSTAPQRRERDAAGATFASERASIAAMALDAVQVLGDNGYMSTIAFLHAHPDDESIFTGGTLALLADRGVRTVVVLATGDAVRIAEAHAACRELGVAALHPLGYMDSGVQTVSVGGEAFASCDIDEAAERLACILRQEKVTALVTYDQGGIYSHPDHLAVHRVGHAAAVRAGVSNVYEATVDREYLHFVETHLVGEAVSWLAGEEHLAALNRAPLGVPTVEVTNTVDVSAIDLL